MTRSDNCKECGRAFKRYTYSADFCGSHCRMRFNSRRSKRGAELFDLAMANRFGDQEIRGRLSEDIAAALDRWRIQDKAERDGRESWGRLDRSEIERAIEARAEAKPARSTKREPRK